MTLKLSKLIPALLALTLLQGCIAAAAPALLVGINKNAADTTDWASRVEYMNCRQKRTELARLNKKNNFLANINPADNTALRISALKTEMRKRGCTIPA